MLSDTFTNRVNAPIDCPLKMSTIVWSKCAHYRESYSCLCKEARDRLRIKGQGREALQAQLQRIKKPLPEKPPGWKMERKTRFYMIMDDKGEVVFRATNMKEGEQYLRLVAHVQFLGEENEKLWALLRDELDDIRESAVDAEADTFTP